MPADTALDCQKDRAPHLMACEPCSVDRPAEVPARAAPPRTTTASVVADDEQAAQSAATRTAQALHTVDELLWGLRHHDWRVRNESAIRLAARWGTHERTLPALLEAAVHDRSWQVRSTVMMRLTEFADGSVLPVLQAAVHDLHEDVRWSAQFALFQKGMGAEPGLLGGCDDPQCSCCNRDDADWNLGHEA